MSLLKDAQAFYVKSDFEAFDLVCRHLISQKAKCFGPFGDCAYRGVVNNDNNEDLHEYTDFIYHDGKACAVGVLIKDEFYTSDLEGNTVHYDLTEEALFSSHPKWNITDKTKVMLDNLQHLHDHMDVELWPAYLFYMTNFFETDENGENFLVVNLEKERIDYAINNIDVSLVTSGSFENDSEKLFAILDEMKGVKR